MKTIHEFRKQHAFTLVELLVVIAVISILAGLLLPALEDALTMARIADCVNRKRELGLADSYYIEDSDGWFTPHYNRGYSNASTYPYYHSPSYVWLLNDLYLSYDPAVLYTISGSAYSRLIKGTIFDCPLFNSLNQYGYLKVCNHIGNYDTDIALNIGLHSAAGTDGFARNAPNWTGGDSVCVKPTTSSSYQYYWTLRKINQLESAPSTVPNFTDGFGCSGRSIFSTYQRGFTLEEHGDTDNFGRVVVWADLHTSTEQFGFEWNNH